MNRRLPTHLVVGALLRRANDAGGMAVIRARGDPDSGSILIVLEREEILLERTMAMDGGDTLVRVGPVTRGPGDSIDDYWQRRRQRDPDLWVVALDIAEAERFAAETILAD